MRSSRIRLMLAAALFAGTAAIAQSPPSASAPPPPPPPAVDTVPARPAADMQRLLDAHAALRPLPIETLTPAQARIQPTIADAVRSVMAQRGMATTPDPTVMTTQLAYGSHAQQVARIYRPVASADARDLPVLVYYHGGGFVIADLDVYDATPRALSRRLNAIVVSVEYRHAPEAKFPAQHDDALAAYRWVLDNAASWGGDPTRLAISGESAGGNLAVATAIAARDAGLTMPRHILAVYPIANAEMMLPSRRDSANARPLNAAMLGWFAHYYQARAADARDPRLDLVNADLRGLPATTIVLAEIDPLRSDGETLATALRRARVPVQSRIFRGVTHEFFGTAAVVRGAYDAQAYAASRLRPDLRASRSRR